MGIQGLLKALEPVAVKTNVSSLKGETVAVDAYVWLHRAVIGCAQELVTGQCHPRRYVDYCMHRVRMLIYHGVKPIIVFDGGHLPAKAHTEADRRGRRREALAKAQALLRQNMAKAARDQFVKAVDVSPQYAYQFIKALRKEGVRYIVAPYEADAQMAFLALNKIVSAIITEDSDLLLFSTTPPDLSPIKILYKMTPEGDCLCLERSKLGQVPGMDMSGWKDDMFRAMAILSGCDYLAGIPGMGLRSAHRLMRKYRDPMRVIKMTRLEQGLSKVPEDYELNFQKAELTFRHQRVWDPVRQVLTTVQPIPEHLKIEADHWTFIGSPMSDSTARGVAEGDLCPISKSQIVDSAPDFCVSGSETQNADRATRSFYVKRQVTSTDRPDDTRSLLTYFPKTSSSPKISQLSLIQSQTSSDRTPLKDVTNTGSRGSQTEARTVSRFFAQTCATEPPSFAQRWTSGSDFTSPEGHGQKNMESIDLVLADKENAPGSGRSNGNKNGHMSDLSSPRSVQYETAPSLTFEEDDEDLRNAIAASLEEYKRTEPCASPSVQYLGTRRTDSGICLVSPAQVDDSPSPASRFAAFAFKATGKRPRESLSSTDSRKVLVFDSSPSQPSQGASVKMTKRTVSDTKRKSIVHSQATRKVSDSPLARAFQNGRASLVESDPKDRVQSPRPSRPLFSAFQCPL